MTADEENYEEAIRAVNSSFGGGKPSTALQNIFDDKSCNELNKNVYTTLFYKQLFSIDIRFHSVILFGSSSVLFETLFKARTTAICHLQACCQI